MLPLAALMHQRQSADHPGEPEAGSSLARIVLRPGGCPLRSDLIAVSLLGWMHFNGLLLLQARYGVSLREGLLVSAPGFSLALVLIGLLFAQRWRASYNTLAKEVGGSRDPVAALGRLAYPGRLLPLPLSNWNRWQRTRSLHRISIVGMNHNGAFGPFSVADRSQVVQEIVRELELTSA